MLSILIPTFNYNALQLVKELHSQCLYEKFIFEIICYDNGSNSTENILNDQINFLSDCTFIALKNNGGRSKLRNTLAQKAKYNWLLFLDVDVLPASEKFIQNYLSFINSGINEICFGGLKYVDEKPCLERTLRWTYGKKREEIALSKRLENPSEYFTSANFLITKKLFFEYQFDESLTKYGLEDTLLAIQLKRDQIEISQIENPVYHLGIDINSVFISKTKQVIENLKILFDDNKIVESESKLLRTSQKFNEVGVDKMLSFIYLHFNGVLEKNLNSKNPSLLIYDLYKLSYLSFINNQN